MVGGAGRDHSHFRSAAVGKELKFQESAYFPSEYAEAVGNRHGRLNGNSRDGADNTLDIFS